MSKCLVSPLSCILTLLGHLHLSDKPVEFDVCQGLCEAIGNHFICWDVREFDLLHCNLIANIMMLDVYMLGPGMEDRVVGQGN